MHHYLCQTKGNPCVIATPQVYSCKLVNEKCKLEVLKPDIMHKSVQYE